MNAQDPLRLDGRVVFLSGPGGYLGHEAAWATRASSTRVDCKPPVLFFGKSCIELCHGPDVDGGRRMDGLVG